MEKKKEEKEKRKKKLTYEFNGHLSLPETRFQNQRSCQYLVMSNNIQHNVSQYLTQCLTIYTYI